MGTLRNVLQGFLSVALALIVVPVVIGLFLFGAAIVGTLLPIIIVILIVGGAALVINESMNRDDTDDY